MSICCGSALLCSKHLFGNMKFSASITSCCIIHFVRIVSLDVNSHTHTHTHTLQGVLEVDRERGLTLTEVAEGVSVEDVRTSTGCDFQVATTHSILHIGGTSL